MTAAIGIDLGTTFCCVGIWKNGRVEIIPNDQGDRTTPSYISFSEEGRLIGSAAKNKTSLNPVNTVYDVKRIIGKKFNDEQLLKDMKIWPFVVESTEEEEPVIVVNESKYKPEQLSAMILRKLKDDAEAYTGEEIKDAVITVPAYFNDACRQATKEAGIIAGLNVLRIINEPTAAALAYGLESKSDNGQRHVLIFDCGGGTFDVTILSIENGMFEVVATGGDVHLGGQDFDQRLVDYCVKDINTKYPLYDFSNKKSMKRLKNACERAKKILSTNTTTCIELECLIGDKDYCINISRAKFEHLCEDLFRKCISVVDQVLMDADMDRRNIDDVVLVGGSTRIPFIQNLLMNHFNGKNLCKSLHPDEAVAYGAAVQAAVLKGCSDDNIKKLLLLDVCPLSLGIETSREIMSVMIPRNTTIPCKKKQVFTTYEDDQEEVSIKIFEGERTFTKDNNLLGTFDLSGIAKAPRGTPQIEVCFSIDANGVLTVTAKDLTAGTEKTMVVKKDGKNTSKDQIEKLLNEAKQHYNEDKIARERIDLLNEIESYLYVFKSNNHPILKDISEWFDQKGRIAAIEELRSQKQKLSHLFAHESES